jgi:hypothetical protein
MDGKSRNSRRKATSSVVAAGPSTLKQLARQPSDEYQLWFRQCLVRVAATAIATECVIGSVRGDHKSAANQSDEDLDSM